MSSKDDLFKPKVDYKTRYIRECEIGKYTYDGVKRLLLDSSLISQTNKKLTNVKIIDCGKYKKVYYYEMARFKKEYDKFKCKDKPSFLKTFLFPVSKINNSNSYFKHIELKNIIRSKNEMQNLCATNEEIFKTFITLTFEENLQDLSKANDIFNTWKTYIKRLYPTFAYICVPEFQKRGAVHYHLMTNIAYDNFNLLSSDEKHIWKPKKHKWFIGRTVKGWKYGISMVNDLKDYNVVSYLSKYMTKDIDNRLFGHHRYFYSQNLKKPIVYNLDLHNPEDLLLLDKLLPNNSELKFKSSFKDFFDSIVHFFEFIIIRNNQE